MAEIQSALVTAQLSPENKEKLENALGNATIYFCQPQDKEAISRCIQDVDVAILNGDADAQILSGKKLRWIHCCHAGVEKTICPEIFERNIVLTSSSGRSAPALAEHVAMFMLALTYDIAFLLDQKTQHHWMAGGAYSEKTGLYGKTVGIIGLGKTGSEVAKIAKCFHMKVIGWRRSRKETENVDSVYASDNGEGIIPLLEESDYVVLSVELNDKTWHLINEETLKHMKETAFLINIGRGGLIDEPALIRALQDRSIAGAGLDTFETEPLPQDSPLWDLDNVIITPHTTPKLPNREERALDYVLKNIEAYREDGKFINRLSLRDMYTHYQANK